MSTATSASRKPVCENRTIYLICIMPEQDFAVSDKKCESNLPIDLHVNIGLHVFSWANLPSEPSEQDLQDLQDILQDTDGICDGVLIYALPETQNNIVSLLNFSEILLPVLKNSRLYVDLTTISLKSSLPRTEVLRNFGIPYDMLPNIKIINAFPVTRPPSVFGSMFRPKLGENDLKLTKTPPPMIGKRMRVLEKGNVYDCIVQSYSDSNDLSCKPWFKWYMQRAFTCLTGRLIQFTGTCYLNSALNAFILSDLGSYMLSVIMPLLFPDYKERFAKPLAACPPKHLLDDTNFVFHMLYQTKCFKQHFSKETDFLTEYAKQRLVSQGTFKPKTVKEILFASQTPFAQKLELLSDRYKTVGQGGQPFDTFMEIIENIDNELSRTDLLTISSLTSPKAESRVMLYQSYFFLLQQESNVPATHYPAIALLWFYVPESSYAHAVCGFVCDGQKAIFNSNGTFEFVDWETEDGLEMYKHSLKSELRVDNVDQIIFEKDNSYIIYLNKSLPIDLEKVC